MTYSEKAEGKKIISQKDINNFKTYIDKKYSNLELENREAILYNSVTYVVDRDLTALNIPKHETAVKILVDKMIFEKKEDLFTDDIIEENVMEIDKSEVSIPQPISSTNILSQQLETPISIESKEDDVSLYLPKVKPLQWVLLLAISLVLFAGFLTYDKQPVDDTYFVEEEKAVLPTHILHRFQKPNKHFPSYFYYREIDEDGLKQYLQGRNSLFQEEPYFSEVIHTAKQFNLNPLLLFAIAGHEQGFVPMDHPYGELMINNPYNVFGSWQVYNTSLKQTSEITSRTIYNSLAELPPFVDPFFWLNRRYAEDPDWWRGVKSIFRSLQNIA